MKPRWLMPLVWAMVAAIALLTLFRPASSAGSLSYRPDSVEYASVGYRLAFEATPRIPIGGEDQPSRYPPWFSLLFAASSYRLLGPEPGNPIYLVTLAGVIGVLTAFGTGLRTSGLAGGSAALLCLLALPGYRAWGREILTDVPAAAMFLIAAGLYVRLAAKPLPDWRLLAGAGLAVALAAAIRSSAAAAAIPFLFLILRRGWARRLSVWLAAFIPLALVLAANAIYNGRVFGSPFRNGYHYWFAVPYDYFSWTFSTIYLTDNLREFWLSGTVTLLLIGLIAWLWMRRRGEVEPASRTGLAALWTYTALAGGPILLLHLFYYYPDARFLIPVAVLVSVAVGSLVGALVPPHREWVGGGGLLTACVLAASLCVTQTHTPSLERLALERVVRLVGHDAVVVSAVDPLYVHLLFKFDPSIRVVPLSRRTDYASTFVSPRKTRDPRPAPRGAWDHRCPGLLQDGNSREAVAVVADENPEWLEDTLRRGGRVYLHTALVYRETQASLDRLASRFACRPLAPDLYQLSLP